MRGNGAFVFFILLGFFGTGGEFFLVAYFIGYN